MPRNDRIRGRFRIPVLPKTPQAKEAGENACRTSGRKSRICSATRRIALGLIFFLPRKSAYATGICPSGSEWFPVLGRRMVLQERTSCPSRLISLAMGSGACRSMILMVLIPVYSSAYCFIEIMFMKLPQREPFCFPPRVYALQCFRLRCLSRLATSPVLSLDWCASGPFGSARKGLAWRMCIENETPCHFQCR